MDEIVEVSLQMPTISSVLRGPAVPAPRSDGMFPSWSDVLAARTPAEFGEAESDQALTDIPNDKWVNIVLMNDGGGDVLRWAVDGSTEAVMALGGYSFSYLERGESVGECYWGEMVRKGEQAKVRPAVP